MSPAQGEFFRSLLEVKLGVGIRSAVKKVKIRMEQKGFEPQK
jgi:hypothetical protein